MANICLVACSRTKAAARAPAKSLYTSSLFVKSRQFAEHFFDRWFVLSAKHGLIEPAKIVAPYDITLNTMSIDDRQDWSRRVLKDLQRHLSNSDEITLIAGHKYRQFLVPALQLLGYKVHVPVRGMSIGRQLRWLNTLSSSRQRFEDVSLFYSLIKELEQGLDGKRVLGKCSGENKWPERGVYFLFETGEYRAWQEHILRLVRVGTHMVSTGSKATLWNRLHTHRGTVNGLGNHRGSIFRLHVGRALMRRANRSPLLKSWGYGQSSTPAIRKVEEYLESQVSQHISEMRVLWISVADESGPSSDRAFIERNSIGLISGFRRPIDPPTSKWLGHFSDKEEIRESGLWNVDYVDSSYDRTFLQVLADYVDVTLHRRSAPKSSLAPKGWYHRKNTSTAGQYTLFSAERL